MRGPKEQPSKILVFRIEPDGARRKVDAVGPSEIFYCHCTQRVHVEDQEIHDEEVCRGTS
jgi:hypothetical protein